MTETNRADQTICWCGSAKEVRDGVCFKHRIQSIRFNPGQLVNRLHPGMTMKESADKIVKDAEAGGHTPIPVGKRWV